MQRSTKISLPDFTRDFSSIADFLGWWLSEPILDPEPAQVLNTYYRGYRASFGSYLRHHYTDQTREICAVIASRDRPRLLEVGAGCGTEALWFALRGARVLAIDINGERLDVARARQRIVEKAIGRSLELEFRLSSLFELAGSDLFDIIWMEQAFHHLEPREEVYPTVARLLAPGGNIVISEANGWNPLLQLALFRRRGFCTVVERVTGNGQRIVYGNERITVPYVLRRGFSRVGIHTQLVRYFRTLPNMRIADAFLRLEGLIPQAAKPLFTHYNYVGSKPASGIMPVR
jgi:2-polyprenyl-3-methyl-5-hydroxy-6-metoxy-1,4-benzoquinol methylase